MHLLYGVPMAQDTIFLPQLPKTRYYTIMGPISPKGTPLKLFALANQKTAFPASFLPGSTITISLLPSPPAWPQFPPVVPSFPACPHLLTVSSHECSHLMTSLCMAYIVRSHKVEFPGNRELKDITSRPGPCKSSMQIVSMLWLSRFPSLHPSLPSSPFLPCPPPSSGPCPPVLSLHPSLSFSLSNAELPAEYFEVLEERRATKWREPGCLNHHMAGHLSNPHITHISEQKINLYRVKTLQSWCLCSGSWTIPSNVVAKTCLRLPPSKHIPNCC